MEENRPITYAQLKELCNSLTEKQLQQEVKIWISDDSEPTDVHAAEELGEDIYTFVDHDYSCSKKDFDKDVVLDEYFKPYKDFSDALSKNDFYVTPADRVYLYNF